VDHAGGSVVSSGAEGAEVDDFGRQGLVRCGAGQGDVRSVGVVVGFVVAQDSA